MSLDHRGWNASGAGWETKVGKVLAQSRHVVWTVAATGRAKFAGGVGGGAALSEQQRAVSGAPRLLTGSGQPFALRWSGDPQLDTALDREDAREAAGVLVGADRSTRPVIRWLARSMSGPGDSVEPGDNANLFPLSVVLGVDASDGDPARLAPDDVAAILAAGASPVATTRRAPVRALSRDAMQRLLSGYSRQRRRDLAIELLTDRSGAADDFLRLVDEAADLAYLEAFETPTARVAGLVDHLQWVLAHYRVPSRRMPLAGAKAWRGHSPVELPGGLQVKVPWNREQLEAEAAAFSNCLGSYYGRIELRKLLIATVWDGGCPLAAAEISPSRRLQLLLGIDDEEVDLDTRKIVVGALRQAGILPAPEAPEELTIRERVEGRIACRAALLLAEEFEPEPDAFELAWSGGQDGDRALELLGRHACLLSAGEYEMLRSGRQPDPVEGWSHLGAMLVAVGLPDPALAALDGRAPFRQAARTVGRQVLHGTRRLPKPRAVRDLQFVLGDPTIPQWQHDAFQEVLVQLGR